MGFRGTVQSSYFYTATPVIHLEQRGGGIGWSHLYLKHDVGDSGLRVKCDGVDVCDFTLEGDTNKMSFRMEGRSPFQFTPSALLGGKPEWQLGRLLNYPADLPLVVHPDAVSVRAGKPLLLIATDGSYTGWEAAPGSDNIAWKMPTNVTTAADGDCFKVLSKTARTTELGACGGGSTPSFELPVNFTTSGTNKIQFLNFLGNTRMFMKNSSGIDGVQLETFSGGSQLALFDTSGDGRLELYTGTPSTGATGKFYQADTARVGVEIEAGAFTGETGRLITRDFLSQQRIRVEDSIKIFASGASIPSVELFQGGGNGELLIRNGFGLTASRVTAGGFVYSGSTPQSFTVNISCTAGDGTLTINGSIVTGKTGPC
jgi:hypothetical protein